MNAPLLILSNVIVDDVWLADGTRHSNTLGGAAVYAAVAARHWWPEVAIVAGVGADYPALAGDQLAPYGLRQDGVVERDAHTVQSCLRYFSDGERSETPTYGLDHFARLQLTPDDISASLMPAAGSYVFRDVWPAFWSSFAKHRQQLGTVLWEIDADAAQVEYRAMVEAQLPSIDVFSINRTEARQMLGSTEPADMIAQLTRAGARVTILRMGGEGALISDGRSLLHVRPPPSTVVDVTGGGNAFSAGFLAAWCAEPGNLERAARCAAASAAITLNQQGLPPPATPGQLEQLDRFAAATVVERLLPCD